MQNLRNQFLALLAVTLVAGYVALPLSNKPNVPLLSQAKMELGIDLAGGADRTYRALYGPNDPKRGELTQQIVDVLHNRVNKRGLKDPKITRAGEDMITLQLAGVDKDALNDYKRLIEGVGKLELKEVADSETMDRFNTSGVVPDGYEAKTG